MKRRDLIKLLEDNGYELKRNGSEHDIYSNGKLSQPIPRHKEINERTAKTIIKVGTLRAPTSDAKISFSDIKINKLSKEQYLEILYKEGIILKGAYPIIVSKEKDGYYVFVPDFDISTQGKDMVDAIYMARDAIGLMGIDYEDDGKEIPLANSVKYEVEKDDIVTLVDVDFEEYRKKVDNRAVKKNCTIPYWMNAEAEKEGINFSKVLQEALIKILNTNKMY